jgi:tetratricopeptide (TPR) repeat protein
LFGAAMAAIGCSSQESWNKCKSADPDSRITGCTALIQAGQDTPDHLSVIYDNRGAAYNSKGDRDRAIQDLSEAIRLSPNHAYIYHNRGIVYYEKEDYDRTIQDFNEAISLNPYDASFHYFRGDAYDHKGDFDLAILDHNEAIRLNPNYAVAYDGRGRAYRNKGDFDLAIRDYSEAIRRNPNFASAYNNRGDAYTSKGDYDRAIQDFNEAIRLNPNLAAAYSNRGSVYLSQLNLAGAIKDFEHVITTAPSSKTAVGAALDLHVAMKRQGHDDAQLLAPVAAAADLSKWPGPVLKLDMGQLTADEVMAAAASASANNQKWQICEANYFIAEDALFHHQRTTALAHLKAARDGCPKADGAYGAALVELKRLGAPAAPAQ